MIPPFNATSSKANQGLIATASDDGMIIVYNQSSHRLESTLCPPAGKDISEVKICRFLKGSDIIVGADMAGYLNFYAITPSPRKN
jgi:hypothetical protein